MRKVVERLRGLFDQELHLAGENRNVDVLLVVLRERQRDLLGARKLRFDGRLGGAREIRIGRCLFGRDLGELLLGVCVDGRTATVAQLGDVSDEGAVGEQPGHPRRSGVGGVYESDSLVHVAERVAREKLARAVDRLRLLSSELVGVQHIEHHVPPECSVRSEHLERRTADRQQRQRARDRLASSCRHAASLGAVDGET